MRRLPRWVRGWLSPGRTWPVSPAGSAHGVALNPWVAITEDGIVTVIIDRSEMGQGVSTSLAMLVAEELSVDLEQVRTAFAPASPEYFNTLLGEQGTGGSTSVRGSWESLRQAGASAREQLLRAAAETWKADPAQCRAGSGEVLHLPTGRSLSYGSLARRAAAVKAPRQVPPKPPEAWTMIGRSVPRLEVPDMVMGRTTYGADVSVPGMLVAMVQRCPVVGGRAGGFDASAALEVQGVRHVVEIDSGVAVVADDFWSAQSGRERLQVQWQEGPHSGLGSDEIRHGLLGALQRCGEVVRDEGDATQALQEAAQVLEVIYETPYLAHGTLEPMNCTAWVREGRCDLWVPTQGQTAAQRAAARASGLPEKRVAVHTTFLGGGFGRRYEQDFVVEAVQISKFVRAPVQVMWTRADDLQHDFYRPAHCALLRAPLDEKGFPQGCWIRMAGPDLVFNGVDIPYALGHIHEEHVLEDPGVPVGAWRSVGASQNAFVVESFVDELAHRCRVDPLQFRLDLLRHSPRHRAVLELAAERSGWAQPLPGCHRGVAVYHCFGSWVAQVAEVSVTAEGTIRVHRIVCAIDCGTVVNPGIVAAQIEGGTAMGLSAALKEEVTVEAGRIRASSFQDYPILTMGEMPEIEVHIVPSPEPPGGVGEPGVPPIAAAVANAVYAATGRRLRRLPLRLEYDG